MTYEEAIKIVKNNIHNDYTWVIVEAIEKQIPKKPLQDRIGDSYHTFPICPTCKCGLDEVIDEHHCSCGQAIDWSDVE